MSDDVAMIVKGVSKTFRLPHEKHSSIKGALIGAARGSHKGYEVQKALTNISFEVKKGEFFGIVGRNGSGKSTLLKILAGIYTPTKGSVQINGSLTPFIELGVGFNPELTGRENVFLNGALLGFSRPEMRKMYSDIVEFAELQKFMDQKLKNYSSGMQVRLAFSIAIRAQSDILLIDEVLAVGDAAFQKKCFDVFRQLKKEGRTIVLVTHDMGNVERFCDRALVINDGEQLTVAKPHETASLYARLNVEHQNGKEEAKKSVTKKRWGNGGVKVKDVTIGQQGKAKKILTFGEDTTITLTLDRTKKHLKTPVVCGFAIYNADGVVVAGPNSIDTEVDTLSNTLKCELSKLPIAPGEYKMSIVLYDDPLSSPLDYLDKWLTFTVIADHTVHGIVELQDKWTGA
jgi:ABC-2 type transport system ATP-binding protein